MNVDRANLTKWQILCMWKSYGMMYLKQRSKPHDNVSARFPDAEVFLLD